MKNKKRFSVYFLVLLVINAGISLYFFFVSGEDDKHIYILFFNIAAFIAFFFLFGFIHFYKKSIPHVHIEIAFFIMSIFTLLGTLFFFKDGEAFDLMPMTIYNGVFLSSFYHIDWKRDIK
ncbi:MAG: hypothetical protein J6I73_09495 [Treponema sp.]|nr:hypothetical protein [Treponema sp.]